jgi:hypothetical protein
MALVNKVNQIIEKAEAIEQLSMWEQPKAAKLLVKDDVVPLLLEVAEFIDEVRHDESQGTELVNVVDVMNEFQKKLEGLTEALKKGTEGMIAKTAELEKNIIDLEKKMGLTILGSQKKTAPKKPLPAVNA